LISEAVRGEGAILRNLDGEDIMTGVHELGSLAPRDIVAREIDRQMKRRGDRYVHLDTTAIGAREFEERFPAISERLHEFGIRPGVDPIPVVPAAHYMCGGVAVDLHGRTEIEGLFATGEVACTGLHGANRLASNSLLEALVFADRASRVPGPTDVAPTPPLPAGPGDGGPPPDEGVILEHDWDAVRRLMWDYVGLVRTRERLQQARTRLDGIQKWAEDLYRRCPPNADLAELRNIALVGLLLASAASERRESRGLHYLAGQTATDPVPRESWAVWRPGELPHVELRPLPAASVATGGRTDPEDGSRDAST
ncbi:MAG: FAD-binding protein, partial [Gemmatimonadetes bacterium]|nr:FAD-binding protein [Gemmatimonadota bacterium]